MISAYLGTGSVRPGDRLSIHARDLRARVSVRNWQHSDPNPRGPGVLATTCAFGDGDLHAGEAPTDRGSWLAATGVLPDGIDFTVSLWIRPTALDDEVVVLSWSTNLGEVSLRSRDGKLELCTRGGDARDSVIREVSGLRLREREWHFVGVTVSADGQPTSVFSAPWGRTGGPFLWQPSAADLGPVLKESDFLVGRAVTESEGRFDGNVSGLRVHSRALDIVELMDLMNGMGDRATHEWRFDERSDPDKAVPVSQGTPPLGMFNAPTWSSLSPPPVESGGHPLTLAGSIHLHRDDVSDCNWPVVAEIDVPVDADVGFYSVHLVTEDEECDLPFVVSGSRTASLLVPSLTWQAYGNLGRDPESWPGRSHYSLHSDGSPVVITTSRRPCQTFSPQARLQVEGGDGFADGDVVTHLMMADLYAWHWLVTEEVAPGLIDDRELHLAGIDALDGVEVLVLSAHPEYWTPQMLDALQAYLDRGGCLIYLGGNGLYWVTSLHPTAPHLMEVRRWGGSQTCSVDEGDRLHQFEHVTGGLWAEAGRPPNRFVGVGFAGFGAGPALEYERSEASYDSKWSWAFDGVESTRFGSEGINSGAGNEFDRVDPALAAPGALTVLASAVPSTPDHFGVLEYGRARAPHPSVRADMIVATTAAGGLVFSVSAVGASGCLVVEERDAPMRRVVSNVLHHMLDNRGS